MNLRQFDRRKFGTLLAAGMVAPWVRAEEFPSRPVRIVVGFPPGGPTDMMTREIAGALQDRWKQAVVTENKPGAASLPAVEQLIRSPADGYTLMLATDTPIVVLPFLRQKLPYDPLADIKPVAIVGAIPLILVASAASGFKTFSEFVTAAKARPGALDYASNGIGAGLHIAMERMQRAAGIELNHIPYKGSGDALPALVGGQVPVMWDTIPSSLPLIRSGKLIPLAVGGLERVSLLPDVPCMPELGYPGFDVGLWMGLVARSGTPAAILEKIEGDVLAAQQNKSFVERVAARGFERRTAGMAEFAKRIQEDYARNKALFAQLKIKKD
ncbi:Bug family tripartite tricarboxylate transporter substrate binding protein [Ramlibacter albus]|uniref:Tripartite tricarboxylate transporter substrate binding protein n=1 Tax=Ramlibacter albus TaxID=2079448 RepID=A0A923S063_9BURK|nr:tripartite tricarboxylate transporter substrate binding protein [Ramlibacter albus]MBC5763009.1 tripartite tricarboxylate transporter substrate binding protein [Ramlibacter albus]